MEISLENKDKIITLLQQGICPICGKKCGFILNHISHKHGISADELKDTLLISRRHSFIPPEQSEKYRMIAIENNYVDKLIPGRKYNSQLTREKMKEITIEHYKKDLSHRNILRKKAEKAVARISPAGKITEYDSIENAAKNMKLERGTISRYIRHKRLDKNGNRWIYKGE